MSRQYDDDDGRTIVNMDVDGMPWHDERLKREKREQEKAERNEAMTPRETARWIRSALLAGLAVVFIISGVLVLLIFIEWIIWKCKKGI